MNKYTKWGIVGVVVVGLSIVGYNSLMPHENEELKTGGVPGGKGRQSKTLNVRAVVMGEQELTDGIFISGSLVPDEEVNLSFETSGKITDIYFKEGAHVERGQLLAKINDAPLQAELRKKEAQLKLMHDRLFRAKALLEKEAVSKEAFQEAEANLTALKAEIDGVKAQIAQTELRAPFSGVIGLRQVSVGAYATTSTAVAMLTKMTPLKVEFSVPERYAGTLPAGTDLTSTAEGDIRHAVRRSMPLTLVLTPKPVHIPSVHSIRTPMANWCRDVMSMSTSPHASTTARWQYRVRPSFLRWVSTRCSSARTARLRL